jgi:hypothetical protein
LLPQEFLCDFSEPAERVGKVQGATVSAVGSNSVSTDANSSGSCRRERREHLQAVGSSDSDLTERFGYARNHGNRLLAMVLAVLFYQSGL